MKGKKIECDKNATDKSKLGVTARPLLEVRTNDELLALCPQPNSIPLEPKGD